MKPLMSLWQRFVAPLVEITDLDLKQEAILLAELSLALFLTSISGILIKVIIHQPIEQRLPILIGQSLFILPYLQSRLGQTRRAVYSITLIGAILIIIGASLVPDEYTPSVLNYFILVTFFASAFLPKRQSFYIISMICITILVFANLYIQIPLARFLQDPFAFNLISACFMIVIMSFQKHLEFQKRQSLEKAEQENVKLIIKQRQYDLLKSFVLAITHDFGTRLSLVEVNSHLLQRSFEQSNNDTRQAKRLEKIRDATRQINAELKKLTIVANLSDVSYRWIDLTSIIDDFYNSLSAKYNPKNITFLKIMPREKVMLFADINHLEIILSQLIENAIIYNRQDGNVIVRCAYQDQYVILSVEDTGEGIDQTNLEKIFEAFYKVDSARTTTHSGLGLGLTIVKMIVDLYAGTIQIESTLGKGTLFTLKFPVEANSATLSV